MRAAERTVLQRHCDALRTVPHSERTGDSLHVFARALQELQEMAKEEGRGLMDVKGNSTIYGVETQGNGQHRQEWNKETYEQILQLLHRAEAIGNEVCSYCVNEDIMGSSGSSIIHEARKQSAPLPYLQPPLTVAEMLMLVRNTYVLLRELHAYRGRVYPDSSQEENTAAIDYAKRAYILQRRMHTIIQQLKTNKSLQVGSSVDDFYNKLAVIESECNTLQFARSEMQIGVLYGLVGQHDMAIMNTRAAVQFLTSMTPSKTKSTSLTDNYNNSDNDNQMFKESRRLLAVAYYNLGCELEQLITVDLKPEERRAMQTERQLAFEQARQLGRQCLEPGHPLLQKLQPVVPSSQTSTPKITAADAGIGIGEKGGVGVALAAARSSSTTSLYPMVQLVQPTPVLPTLPPISFSGRGSSHGTKFSIPIGIYDLPLADSLRNMSKNESGSTFPLAVSLRDRIASLQSEHHVPRVPPPAFTPPTMKTIAAAASRAGKRKESSSLLWFPHKKKNHKQMTLQPTQDILNCHRLKRPSDALRLGGVSVLDTLFIQEHRKAEEEKKRKEEEKKIRIRKRRQRSFLPESWSLVEDAPVTAKKKERGKRKKRKSKGKRYFYKTHGDNADGERDVEEEEGDDEEAEERVRCVDGFVFPNSSMKGKKKKERRKKNSQEEEGEREEKEGEQEEEGEEAHVDGEGKRRKRRRKKRKHNKEGHSTSITNSSDGGVLTASVEQGSTLRATSSENGTIVSTEKSSGESEIKDGSTEKVKKGKSDKEYSEDEDDEETDEDYEEDETDEDEEDDESEDEDGKNKLKGEDESEEEDEDDEPETVNEARERCEMEILTYYDIMYGRRMRAARRIQCAWRCNRARKELHRRQQILYREVYRIQKAAAMCIEGFFCIILEKRRLVQAQERCAAELEAREVLEEKMLRSVLIISRYAKVFLRRRRRERELCKLLSLRNVEELRVREAAAIIISRWWRIVPAQRAYWQRRTIEVREQQEKEALERQRQFAAVQLQRHFRGLLGRREAQQWRERRVEEHRLRQQRLRECTDLVRLCLQEYTRRCERMALEAQQQEQRRTEAAAVIQIGWRAALQRQMMRNVITRCRRIVRAVLTIQRAYRRFCAGREIRYLRRVQEAVQHERIDRECYVYRATLTLQCFARVVLAKRAARHRRAAIGRGFFFAAITIQSVCRGGTTRQQLGAALQMRRHTELLLRSIAEAQRQRVADVLAAFLQARASGFVVETRRCRRLTEKLYMRRRVRWELLQEKSAAVIQRAFRKMQRRRQEREAAEQQQQQRALVLRCVIRIQALLRGALARREYRHRRYLVQKQQRKREEMEEVMLQCFVDEWRAALLRHEGDRRRIKVMEEQERAVLEYYYNNNSQVGLGAAVAAATALAEAAKKATVSRVLHNFYTNIDDDENDEDEGECNLSTYRDDP